MTTFDGQVVIVTGAASGIGLGIARAFHDAGASVVLGDMQEDALDQAQATFTDQERLAFVPVDVRDAAAVANLVWATRGHGRERGHCSKCFGAKHGRVGMGRRHRDEPSGRVSVVPSRGAEHASAPDAWSDRDHLIHRP